MDNNKNGDEIVEMRFYVPGTIENETTIVKNETNGDVVEEAVVNETSAAQQFYEQLKDKADIGQVAGEAIVSFSDVLFLTPRGRYDIDMYPSSLRLRGKTYDYKIQYEQIERIFSLPKPDETHHLIVLQIDPPLRQGQTRYPFLVLQFVKDEETELELNVSDEDFEKKYKDRLKKTYDAPTNVVMSHCLRGLTERKLITPGAFQSRYLQAGVPCSVKASEGYLFPLDRCFLFVTKPTLYIPYSEISSVVMSRTGGGVSASRTFDLEVNVIGSNQPHVFSNIDREEQEFIESFCKEKGVKVKNEEKLPRQDWPRLLNKKPMMTTTKMLIWEVLAMKTKMRMSISNQDPILMLLKSLIVMQHLQVMMMKKWLIARKPMTDHLRKGQELEAGKSTDTEGRIVFQLTLRICCTTLNFCIL